jgi:hypothetical protein
MTRGRVISTCFPRPWVPVSRIPEYLFPATNYLIAPHGTAEHDREGVAAAERAYRGAGVPAVFRDSDEFAELAFGSLELVPAGVVLVSEWQPGAEILTL